jgi:hypothetical protein
VLYLDVVGRKDSATFEIGDNPTVKNFIAECERHLPPPSESPAKSEVEQEIAELEYRLKMLKESIGAV